MCHASPAGLNVVFSSYTLYLRWPLAVNHDNRISTVSRGKDVSLRIGRRVRDLRAANSYTQERLAELSGVDYKHIQLMESSQPTAARIDTLEKVAGAFGMGLAEFFACPEFAGKKNRKGKSRGA